MDEISEKNSLSWSSGSGDDSILADSIHSRVQHFYLHTKNTLSKIIVESEIVFQHTNQQEVRSQPPEITPTPETIEVPPVARPPWTALPSVVTWYKIPQNNESEQSTLRFLSHIAQPIKAASESLLVPLALIGSNLADAWDLRDLAEDLRFRGGVPRPHQGGAACSGCRAPYNLT
jgi:hypothetical protein